MAKLQPKLGVRYTNGKGVPRDYVQAVEWYRKAAEQGFTTAQFNLASMYQSGQGVPKDLGQAVVWYRKAAAQGYANAQSNLGFMYQNGLGVEKDSGQAVAWYSKAAEQGLATAQINLGLMYYSGRGVPKNRVAAYALLDLSAAKDAIAQGASAIDRTVVAKAMTPQEIEAAQHLSRDMSKPKNLQRALDQFIKQGH